MNAATATQETMIAKTRWRLADAVRSRDEQRGCDVAPTARSRKRRGDRTSAGGGKAIRKHTIRPRATHDRSWKVMHRPSEDDGPNTNCHEDGTPPEFGRYSSTTWTGLSVCSNSWPQRGGATDAARGDSCAHPGDGDRTGQHRTTGQAADASPELVDDQHQRSTSGPNNAWYRASVNPWW